MVLTAALDPGHRARYFPVLEIDELAAVDRFGGVHRLNPHHVRDIERQLAEPKPNSIAPVDAPAWQPLPSVVELRAGFEGDRDPQGRAFTTPSSRDTSRTAPLSWRSTSTVWSRPKGGRSYGRPRAPPRRSRMRHSRRRLPPPPKSSTWRAWLAWRRGQDRDRSSGIIWVGYSAGRSLPGSRRMRRRRRAATRKPCMHVITPRRFKRRRRNLTSACTRKRPPTSRNGI